MKEVRWDEVRWVLHIIRHSGVQYSGEEDCATDSVSNKDTLVHNTVVL